MAKQAAMQSEQLKGTVADLAGHISVNGGEPLNQQDVQFLTRILRDTGFAKPIDTAPASGKRGGKRATVWQLMPNIKISLTEAANVPATKAAKGASNATVNTKSPEFKKAVQQAVQEAMQANATAKRKPGRTSKAAGK
jgi:organic radical activating enzyme